MSDDSADSRWVIAAATARRALARRPARDERAPLGFAARVVARAFEQRREWLASLWQRWSLRAALLSGGTALAVAWLALRHDAGPRLEVPATLLEAPALPASP